MPPLSPRTEIRYTPGYPAVSFDSDEGREIVVLDPAYMPMDTWLREIGMEPHFIREICSTVFNHQQQMEGSLVQPEDFMITTEPSGDELAAWLKGDRPVSRRQQLSETIAKKINKRHQDRYSYKKNITQYYGASNPIEEIDALRVLDQSPIKPRETDPNRATLGLMGMLRMSLKNLLEQNRMHSDYHPNFMVGIKDARDSDHTFRRYIEISKQTQVIMLDRYTYLEEEAQKMDAVAKRFAIAETVQILKKDIEALLEDSEIKLPLEETSTNSHDTEYAEFSTALLETRNDLLHCMYALTSTFEKMGSAEHSHISRVRHY